MAFSYGDRVRVVTATTGTGTVTLGAAVSSYRTFAEAGVSDAASVTYLIRDGAAWEVGTGVYTSSGTTMTRVLRASSTGSLLSLTGNAVVILDVLATELADMLLGADNLSGIADAAAARATLIAEQLGVSRGIRAHTGTADTFVLADAGKTITSDNGSAVAQSIPTEASVAFVIGTYINIHQLGGGQVTIGGAGVTILSKNGTKLSGQYSTGTIQKLLTNTWILAGDVTT